MKFDGINWVYVGTAGFSAGGTAWTSLVFSSSGQPYVGYRDCGNDCKATVMKLNGNIWENVGNSGFSDGQTAENCIAISQSDELFVAFRDDENSHKATVMKFDGSNWVAVGNEGFSLSTAYYPSLALNAEGVPYLAYGDIGNGDKATVMKYDSVSVGVNEIKTSSQTMNILPNPAQDQITIQPTGINTEAHLSVLDINGRELLKSKINGPKTLVDISMLESGVYMVKVFDDEKVLLGKFIKK
jgi:hypothetical protein